MRILIINTHSTLNAGDAGIVIAQIQMLRKYFPHADIGLTSRTPRIDGGIYRPLGLTIFPPLIPAPSVYVSVWARIWESLKNLMDVPSKYRLFKAMKHCDLVISSGGGYLFSNRRWFPGPMFFQNLLILKLAGLFKKPTILFPQSIGPFHNKTALKLLSQTLKKSSIIKIFAREKRSELLLSQLGKTISQKTSLCPDMIFYLTKTSNQANLLSKLDLPRPIIGVTVRYWDFPEIPLQQKKREMRDAFVRAIGDICVEIFKNYGGSILIFPQVRGPGTFENDRNTSRILFSQLRDIPNSHKMCLDLADDASPMDIMSINSHIDLIIATRLHSALLALLTRTPVITVSYQPKSWGIMEMLDMEHCCFDISDLRPADVSQSIKKILDDPDPFHAEINKVVNHMQKTLTTSMDTLFHNPPFSDQP